MNYKIKITEENQAIVERIANKNGMNPNGFIIIFIRFFYTIENGIFERCITSSDYPELTTEQFIEIFDKKNKQERMFSEEEVIEIFNQYEKHYRKAEFNQWFEQVKKK